MVLDATILSVSESQVAPVDSCAFNDSRNVHWDGEKLSTLLSLE